MVDKDTWIYDIKCGKGEKYAVFCFFLVNEYGGYNLNPCSRSSLNPGKNEKSIFPKSL